VSIKRGLPAGVGLRHDAHYVEEISKVTRSVGRIIQIDKIEPNPLQPRSEFGDLTELTSSIKEKGVLEPLLVKPVGIDNWMIIAGERRWRAATLAGLTEVPCVELDIDEKGIAEIALIENLQRKDLTVWEEADGLASLASRFGYTHDEIAKKIGKSRTTVTESLAIAGLPKDVREKCRDNKINAKSTLLEISRQFDQDSMLDLLGKIESNGLVTREKIRQEIRPTPPKPQVESIASIAAKPEPKLQSTTEQKPDFEAQKHLSAPSYESSYESQKELSALANMPLANAPTRLQSEQKAAVFLYVPTSHDFKLEINFHKKTKYNLDDVIEALEKTLNYWKQTK
jgi:ParB family transcriptional regulator, chromosome partitioning protein